MFRYTNPLFSAEISTADLKKKRVKLWFYPFFPVLTAANRHFVPSCRCFTCHSQVAARAQGLPGLPGCDWSSPRRVQQSDVVRTSELPY